MQAELKKNYIVLIFQAFQLRQIFLSLCAFYQGTTVMADKFSKSPKTDAITSCPLFS